MKLLLLVILAIAASSCASLSEKGQLVEVILVQKSARQIKNAKLKLQKDKCKSLGKVEAGPTIGSTPFQGRLLDGLKNKVGEMNGNAVITSLSTHGFPLKTYGLAYMCPSDQGVDTDI